MRAESPRPEPSVNSQRIIERVRQVGSESNVSLPEGLMQPAHGVEIVPVAAAVFLLLDCHFCWPAIPSIGGCSDLVLQASYLFDLDRNGVVRLEQPRLAGVHVDEHLVDLAVLDLDAFRHADASTGPGGDDVAWRRMRRKDETFDYDWFANKGNDTFGPIGPYIVPRKFVPDPQNLAIKCYVSGELMQDTSTKHMVWSVRRAHRQLQLNHDAWCACWKPTRRCFASDALARMKASPWRWVRFSAAAGR
jgi:hypothetical protein